MNTNAKVKLGIFYLNLDIGPLVDINEIFISCQNFKYFVPNQMVSLNFFLVYVVLFPTMNFQQMLMQWTPKWDSV